MYAQKCAPSALCTPPCKFPYSHGPPVSFTYTVCMINWVLPQGAQSGGADEEDADVALFKDETSNEPTDTSVLSKNYAGQR